MALNAQLRVAVSLSVGRARRLFVLGMVVSAGVVGVRARWHRCAAQPNDRRDQVDIDLEQVEIARHLSHLLALARDLLGNVAMLRSVTPPEPPTNILALIHASRARCVSRVNFRSTNCRRTSA